MWERIDSDFAGLMAEFEIFLRDQLPQKGSFLSEVSHTVIESGGKRLRPAFILLFAGFGAKPEAMADAAWRDKLFRVSAAVELLHTATLIHDDIIDDADTRRGVPTVSNRYGTNVAVYTGDYLLVQSLSLLAASGLDVERLSDIAKGLAAICMGEVDQYTQKFHISSPVSYLKRITKKTALLFSVSAALGAKLADLPERDIKNAARFGLYFGNAFQIRDDLIDLQGSGQSAGKPVLKDLKDGIVTLPLIAAAKRNPALRDAIEEFFNTRGDGLANEIVESVINSGGITVSEEILRRYVAKAKERLSLLPDGDGRRILLFLLDSMFL